MAVPRTYGLILRLCLATPVSSILIRDAVEADAAAVARLLGEMGYASAPEAATAHIARFRDDPASRLQVAVDPVAGVVGLVATHLVPRLDDDAFTCRITDLVVSTTHRRRGVATQMLAAAESEARRAGVPRLDLTSGEWRAEAHAFYLSHGFTTRARGFTLRLTEPA
jgi:GNAT superfamily N-acetyltransferase